ncbi:MAG: S24 family peptidase [Gammaproteobacteria bacterium]|nr:S24 family peptidase [Gammaproteobacteria bacterium]MYE14260.1 S24 family peptidase [Gammaproteobacteria bacterium]MYF30305.1 S24 family peptidase [Gammaproteobacteria bacterium]
MVVELAGLNWMWASAHLASVGRVRPAIDGLLTSGQLILYKYTTYELSGDLARQDRYWSPEKRRRHRGARIMSGGARRKEPLREGKAVAFGTETFIVRVVDGSMAPQFVVGDYAYVDPDVPAEDGCFVAVRDEGAETMSIRQLVVAGGRWTVRALDESWPDERLQGDSVERICGVVVFTGRKP